MISDKSSYFLEKLNETTMKSSVYSNKLKKFWLQDSQFNISENDEASENDDWDSDIDILKTENNDQDWISKKKICDDNLINWYKIKNFDYFIILI